MKTLENKNSINLTLNFDVEVIDSQVDDLNRQQFSILSWLACNKSREEVAEILGLDRFTLDSEISQILNTFEVETIPQVSALYSFWIQDFEEQMKIKRGY